ncbi:hypothetical protein Nepgr_033205 [Nepenthes gracilis]|uniref:Uncharacterized protein n=1 Tax=Nepenthes gracilis TaxID=150966 RepID=A0AAD3Y6E3_NEPGR|nr:hypothetical protein Nepgr_033205 [Nepenthes gracilis]
MPVRQSSFRADSHQFSSCTPVWLPRVDVMKSKIENGPNVVQLVSSANSSCDLSIGFEMTIKIPSVRKGKAESWSPKILPDDLGISGHQFQESRELPDDKEAKKRMFK